MENGSPSIQDENQALRNRVIAIEQQLAHAQNQIQTLTSIPENGAHRQSELLFAHSRDMILCIRLADGHILDANAAALQGYGYSQAELLNLKIQDLRAPNTVEMTADQMTAADTQGILFETTHRRKDGSTFPVEVSSQGVSINAERTLVSVVRDITERKQGEAERARLLAAIQQEKIEAQQRAEELQAIIEAIRDPVLVYDPEGVIYRANASAVMAHGFDPSRQHRHAANNTLVVRRPDGKIVYSDELPSARALQGETVIGEPLEVTNAHGQDVTVLVTSTPLLINGVKQGAVSVWHDITEQKRLEEALRQARDQAAWLARLPGENPSPVARVSASGVVLYNNPVSAQLPGWTLAIDQPVSPPILPLIEQAMAQSREVQQDIQLGGRFYLISVMPFPDEGYANVYGRDITERKETEAALRESEERYRVAVKNAPSIYAQTDCELRYLWIHNTHPDFRAETVIGKRDDELEDNEDTRRLVALKRQVLESGVGLREELTFTRSDGMRTYDMTIEPLRDLEGQIIGVSTAALDITESKRAQEALRISESRLRRLVEGNIIGVITRDAAGQIKDANDAFLKMTGYTFDELQIGDLNISHLLPREYHHLEEQIVAEVLTSGSSQPHEKEYLRKDGQRVPVIIGYSRLEGSRDEFIGFVLDLSDLKQAQTALVEYAEKLKRSNQELEQFAFVASHDLQEPLRKVTRFSDMVADQLGSEVSSETRNYLKRMQDAAGRMQSMIDGLLDLSRVSTQGKAFETVDLTQIASEVVSDLELRIFQTRGQVQLGSLPEIKADPLQMRQLMQNLIGNALKFNKPDLPPVIFVWGEVIHAINPPDWVVLTVEDNGIGFDEENAQLIFQPFKRLHGRSEYEGTGMGLAICQKIVERHGGKITVRSRPGEGSKFIIELPLQQPA